MLSVEDYQSNLQRREKKQEMPRNHWLLVQNNVLLPLRTGRGLLGDWTSPKGQYSGFETAKYRIEVP
jgi:hypothetical protein